MGIDDHESPCNSVIDLKVQSGRIEERVEHVSDAVASVHEDVKAIHLRLGSVDRTLIVNTHSLQEHMEQTKLLKEQQAEFHKRLTPIETDRLQLKAMVWLVVKAFGIGSAAIVTGYYLCGLLKGLL